MFLPTTIIVDYKRFPLTGALVAAGMGVGIFVRNKEVIV